MAYTDIDKPSDYFNTKLYTGTGTSGSPFSLTGVGFAPNWVWIKRRGGAAVGHRIFDTIRGATKYIDSSANSAETTNTSTLTAFGSDGFTLQNDGSVNDGSEPFVSWNWKETATAGFDIVSYTGSGSAKTVSHSLSAIPKMIIVKNRSSDRNFCVFHTSLGATKFLRLNLTNAEGTSGGRWNDTAPTSSVFTVGDDAEVNSNGDNYIAYCFADVKGYSKVSGSYTGNGNADGTFVYTGFKPAFILAKDADSSDNWIIHDTTRNPSNPVGAYLRPNLSSAEGTFSHYDILSNGFKNLYAGGSLNGSGKNIIYMAFAENPFVTSTGVPATAR